MQVLVVMRDDYETVFGGDLVMVSNLKRHLKSFGIDLRITSAAELVTMQGADVLHLTFLHLPDSANQAIHWAEQLHIPVGMSPLFEDPLHLWFEWATYHPTKWRAIGQLIGTRTARWTYLQWQGSRRARSILWQQQRDILKRVHLIPNSYYELNQLRRWFDLPEMEGFVVPLGIDPEIWSDASVRIEDPVLEKLTGFVLQVGRIETRKNQIGLLRALLNVDIPIVFLGKKSPHPYEAPYVRACENLAEARGRIHFIDWLPLETMPALYRAAAVHVLPSWSELPGLVTLEAAACGCKVVSTSFSPIREYLDNDVWCCRPDQNRSIEKTVREAMRAPAPSELRSKVLHSLTWSHSASRLASVYHSLVT